MKLIIRMLLLSLLILTTSSYSSDWRIPMPSVGVEIGSKNLAFPITIGIAKTLNTGLVGTGSYFIGSVYSSKYFDTQVCIVGTAWAEPIFGGTIGIAVFPMKQIFESKKKQKWVGATFHIASFIAANINNHEEFLATFGLKLIVINK